MQTIRGAFQKVYDEMKQCVDDQSRSCSTGTSCSSSSSREGSPTQDCPSPPQDCPIQAAKKAVFNMLYQYQAIPVRAKILSDCILSTLDENQVTNLLDSAGWSRSDYIRGYRTMPANSSGTDYPSPKDRNRVNSPSGNLATENLLT
ncbi:hypothetical protein TELCIR_14522, partial [Teladorsagia circumcincta]